MRELEVGLSLMTLTPGRVGGSESYVQGLLDSFGLADPALRVRVLANREVAAAYAHLRSPNVAVGRPSRYRPGQAGPRRAAGLLAGLAAGSRLAPGASTELDVVHYPLTVPIPAVAAPSVVTIHDVQHLELPTLFSRAERMFRRVAYDRAARRADAVITVSSDARRRLVRLLGIEPDRVVAIPSGVDHARFHPDATGDRAALAGVALPARYLLYPANLWPHKNHDRLLEAFARSAAPEDLVLSGQPMGRMGSLHHRIRTLGLQGRVHHLGHVSSEAVAPLYRGASAVVFPSLYEGFGLPPLEAMACGTPVVASRRGILAEAPTGVMRECDPLGVDSIASAIDAVLRDRALGAQMVAAGRTWVQGFTWHASAAAHASVYRTVASRAAI